MPALLFSYRPLLILAFGLCVIALNLSNAIAQEATIAPNVGQVSSPEHAVSIAPVARDTEIAERIHEIMETTNWYQNINVTVADGIVFLDGTTASEEQQLWAKNLASKTQDVVAVVNRIDIKTEADWSLQPAIKELQRIGMSVVTSLPLVVFSIIVLPLAWILSNFSYRLAYLGLKNQVASPFLRDVVSKAIALPILLLGIYLILQVAGLTKLAFSLVGGAGVIGIVIGFAFRDIAENFLASLLLSIRQPFSSGDLIEVAGHIGIVQSMNTRSSILLSGEGNHIQIPNSTIFKSTIINYSASPARRLIITIGIGYDASISEAQAIIMEVLEHHHAVKHDPDPLVLVDALATSTVNLMVYVWYDGHKYGLTKVKSSLLRLIKKALTEANISMPDEAREVIFPEGVPVIATSDGGNQSTTKNTPTPSNATTTATVDEDSSQITEAEGDLANEQEELEEQVISAVLPEGQQDLLEPITPINKL